MIQLHPAVRAFALVVLPACGYGGLFVRSDLNTVPIASPKRAHAFVSPSAYEAYVRGEVLLAEGDGPGAIRELRKAAAFADDDLYVHSRLAAALDLAGQRDDAAATLAEVEAAAPCAGPLWQVRGELHVKHRELALAEAAFVRGVACAPDDVEPRLRLAAVLRDLGRQAEALEVLPAPHKSADARLAVARALAEADAAQLAFAFDTWLAEGPVDSETLRAGVERALALQAPHLAARILGHVRTEVDVGLRARVALAEHDVAALRALLDGMPVIGDALTTAEVALAVGDAERALFAATDALARTPDDRARAALARAHLLKGDTASALAVAARVERGALRDALKRELLRDGGSPALASELTP